MQQGFKKYSDMRQDYFLKSTGDIALNKSQRHATLTVEVADAVRALVLVVWVAAAWVRTL